MTKSDGAIVDCNFQAIRGKRHIINWQELLNFLRDPKFPEISIRIGGFNLNCNYGFTSRSQHPFLRGISLQGEIAVAMGWPFGEGGYTTALDELRRSFQKFGVLHKWHQTEDDIDNDFFFVLGRVDRTHVSQAEEELIQAELRALLAGMTLPIVINQRTISFVSYVEPQLPLSTSRNIPIVDTTFGQQEAVAEYSRAQ